MKKILSLLLVLLLTISLVACGGGNTDWNTLESDLAEIGEILGSVADDVDTLLPDESETVEEPENPTVSLTEEGTLPSEGEETSAPQEPTEEATTEAPATVAPTTAPTTEAPTTAPTEKETEKETETTVYNETQDNELPMDFFIPEDDPTEAEPTLDEHGSYTTKEDVALYIHLYGKLPENFITKNQARALGWEGGSLEPYAPGKCIGGDRFGNYEGLLPTDRKYTECDIDTLGAKSRGAKRIVFSKDGLIYYTDDHYESFTLLYGEE